MKKQNKNNPYSTNWTIVVTPDGKTEKKPKATLTKSAGDMRAKGGK
jgi:hypothetical protein